MFSVDRTETNLHISDEQDFPTKAETRSALPNVGSRGNLLSSFPRDLRRPFLSMASRRNNCLRACSSYSRSGISRKSNPSTSSIFIDLRVSTVEVRLTLLISGRVAFGS